MKRTGPILVQGDTIDAVSQWDVALPPVPRNRVSFVAERSVPPATAIEAASIAPDNPPATVSSSPVPEPAASLPSDPDFSQQWYLQNTGQGGGTPGMDIDVVPAWNVATGEGVTIVENDTGIDYTNPDIAPNYDAATSQSLDPPTNSGYPYNTDNLTGSAAADLAHGTWVAGLIAAANNDYGIVGVAYNATISAFRLIDTAADQSDPWESTARALANSANFDVANNSWEFDSPLADSVFNQSATIATDALLTAAETGRGGLGTINVFAAGNYYSDGDDTNLHAFQSSINVVTVAALDDNGTVNAPGGRYSSPGATILVSAPGTGILSDTIVGQGDNSGNFSSGLDGTSFATPLVTGVIALMLQANPNLGLRDVQEILAYTARQTDPTNASWHVNDAVNWNGGGLHVSDDYGFGLVDAAAAVALAQSWTSQDTADNRTIDTVAAQGVGAIEPGTTNFSFTVPTSDSLTLNWVRVQLDFSFSLFDNLKVELISPGGAYSVLLDQPDDGIGADSFDNTVQLTSDQFWGQNSAGTWRVAISNVNSALDSSGTMYSANLVLVGDPPPVNNTYIYTNEYTDEAASDPSREVLSDPGSTADTLNLSAVSDACLVDLVPGKAGNIGGIPFTIAAGTVITNVYTGSGTDTVVVNGNADTITSEEGTDTVVFPDALASYALSRTGANQITVTLGGITDTLDDITTLQFADQRVAVDSVVSCFARGTRITTERGSVAVEALCVGDRMFAQLAGSFVPIVWIGHRRVNCARHPTPKLVWPVHIDAGAFGEHQPARELVLSPDHAVYVDNVLIPVKYLVNGSTIRQVPVAEICYFHVELPHHDVLLAESLPVESFLDTGSRAAFANGGKAALLHPDFSSRAWEAQGCAPLIVTGPTLAAVRRRLRALRDYSSPASRERTARGAG